MNILRGFIKRIEITAFCLGFTAGVYMLVFFPAKYFITPHALPVPPEPIAEIISASHMGDVIIRTTTDEKFICDLDNEKECWAKVDYEPIVFGKIVCFKESCPDNHTVQIVKTTGQYHNFGELSFTYLLHEDGVIYVRQSGRLYLPGYLMGVIFGGICAAIAFVGRVLFLGLISLFRRYPN
jgi:hypothetical protein